MTSLDIETPKSPHSDGKYSGLQLDPLMGLDPTPTPPPMDRKKAVNHSITMSN